MLGGALTAEQKELYTEAPRKRGFLFPVGAKVEQEATLFQAVFVLALASTAIDSGAATHSPVYLFLPKHLEKWGNEEIRKNLMAIFAHCKEHRKPDLARHLGAMAKHIYVGSRVTPSMQAPDKWVAYGFDDSPHVPKWLTEAMLPVYAFPEDDDSTG